MDIDWFDSTNTFGFVAVAVTPESVKIDFINTRGESFEEVVVHAREVPTGGKEDPH